MAMGGIRIDADRASTLVFERAPGPPSVMLSLLVVLLCILGRSFIRKFGDLVLMFLEVLMVTRCGNTFVEIYKGLFAYASSVPNLSRTSVVVLNHRNHYNIPTLRDCNSKE